MLTKEEQEVLKKLEKQIAKDDWRKLRHRLNRWVIDGLKKLELPDLDSELNSE